MVKVAVPEPNPTNDTQPTLTDIRMMKWTVELQRQVAKAQSPIEETEDVNRQNKTVAEVGRRIRLRNHDLQKMLETLIEVWSDDLADSEHAELENFLVLEVKTLDRGERAGSLLVGGKLRRAPRVVKKLTVRPSKSLKERLRP